jgi:hypothetical protein
VLVPRIEKDKTQEEVEMWEERRREDQMSDFGVVYRYCDNDDGDETLALRLVSLTRCHHPKVRGKGPEANQKRSPGKTASQSNPRRRNLRGNRARL